MKGKKSGKKSNSFSPTTLRIVSSISLFVFIFKLLRFFRGDNFWLILNPPLLFGFRTFGWGFGLDVLSLFWILVLTRYVLDKYGVDLAEFFRS